MLALVFGFLTDKLGDQHVVLEPREEGVQLVKAVLLLIGYFWIDVTLLQNSISSICQDKVANESINHSPDEKIGSVSVFQLVNKLRHLLHEGEIARDVLGHRDKSLLVDLKAWIGSQAICQVC